MSVTANSVVEKLRALKDHLTPSLKILIQRVAADKYAVQGEERLSHAALCVHHPVIGYGKDPTSAVLDALAELTEYVEHAASRKIKPFDARASAYQEAFENGTIVPVRIDGLSSYDLSVKASRRDASRMTGGLNEDVPFSLEVREESESHAVAQR